MKNLKIILYTGLLILLIIAFYLWQFTNLCNFNEFGLNFFTEILGIAVTVFFIEKVIEKNKENQKKPITAAAFIDTRLLVSRYISFYQELFRNSVEKPEPNTLKEFLNIKTAEEIWNNLNMNAKPHVFPEINMWTYFHNNGKNIHEISKGILDRHGWHLDSYVYKYIHDIAESQTITFWRDHILSIYKFDNLKGFKRPKLLASYSTLPTQEEFDSVYKLHEWCQHVSNDLGNEFGIANLYKYTTIEYNKRKFPFKKNPVELLNELKEWNESQNK